MWDLGSGTEHTPIKFSLYSFFFHLLYLLPPGPFTPPWPPQSSSSQPAASSPPYKAAEHVSWGLAGREEDPSTLLWARGGKEVSGPGTSSCELFQR